MSEQAKASWVLEQGKGNVLRVYSVQPRASRWMDGWMRLKVYDLTLGQSRGLAGQAEEAMNRLMVLMPI